MKTFSFILMLFVYSNLFSQVNPSDSPFYETMRTLNPSDREALVYKEIINGNVPSYMHHFVTIHTKQRDAKGVKHKVTLFVAPDYLSIGNDTATFLIPMMPVTAQRIADTLRCSLPTPKVVDIIYQHATLKLEPFNYIPRGNRNETPDIWNDHSRTVFAQMKAAGEKPGVFVAGTKKDIVISSKLEDSLRTHHVIIYGWHRLNGTPIQPVYNKHLDTYVDYSHGVRLVSNNVIVDGKEYDYRTILRNPLLYTLLSNEPKPMKRISYTR